MAASEATIPATEYLTTARLARDAAAFAARFPHVSGVVGVARSGLIPAAVVAAHLHRPLWSVSRDRGVKPLGGGSRMGGDRAVPDRVLVIDDTAYQGTAMRAAAAAVRAAFPASAVETAVVYAHPNGRAAADHAFAVYPGSHYLEWNLFNGPLARRAGFDLDGILCRDPTPAEDDDGPRYRAFLAGAAPLHLPRREPVPLIVTARAEAYRAETEAWLRRHGVRWAKLVMRPFPRPGRADWVDAIAEYKAREVVAGGLALFVESCPLLARRVADLARRPALCPAAGRAFVPGG